MLIKSALILSEKLISFSSINSSIAKEEKEEVFVENSLNKCLNFFFLFSSK